jgi:hypothetical protein
MRNLVIARQRSMHFSAGCSPPVLPGADEQQISRSCCSQGNQSFTNLFEHNGFLLGEGHAEAKLSAA